MNDTEAACLALTRTGNALATATLHQLRIISLADGWPARGDSAGSRSSDGTSTTERSALALLDRGHEASQAKANIEDVRDWWTGLRTYLADGARLAANLTAKQDRPGVLICDGRQFEGSELAWTPHSRAHDNGWHDALCLDAADDSGLCPKCRIRERRWREANGLRARNRNRAEDAA